MLDVLLSTCERRSPPPQGGPGQSVYQGLLRQRLSTRNGTGCCTSVPGPLHCPARPTRRSAGTRLIRRRRLRIGPDRRELLTRHINRLHTRAETAPSNIPTQPSAADFALAPTRPRPLCLGILGHRSPATEATSISAADRGVASGSPLGRLLRGDVPGPGWLRGSSTSRSVDVVPLCVFRAPPRLCRCGWGSRRCGGE